MGFTPFNPSTFLNQQQIGFTPFDPSTFLNQQQMGFTPFDPSIFLITGLDMSREQQSSMFYELSHYL